MDKGRELVGEGDQKMGKPDCALLSCQTGQDTSRTQAHEPRCTGIVLKVGGGFLGTAQKYSSLVFFGIHNDLMEAMAVAVTVVAVVMVRLPVAEVHDGSHFLMSL